MKVTKTCNPEVILDESKQLGSIPLGPVVRRHRHLPQPGKRAGFRNHDHTCDEPGRMIKHTEMHLITFAFELFVKKTQTQRLSENRIPEHAFFFEFR
jgi:hypothetical protein